MKRTELVIENTFKSITEENFSEEHLSHSRAWGWEVKKRGILLNKYF